MKDAKTAISSIGGPLQDDSDRSFVGGLPCLPAQTTIPTCGLCGMLQSFFFQLAFPEGHSWHGLTLAVFSCTSCVNEAFLIPEMLPGPLRGISVSEEFLRSYQRNFRFIVFDSSLGQLLTAYEPRVAFRRLQIGRSSPAGDVIGHVGGTPRWVLDDESPGSCGETDPMHFLFQLNAGLHYPIIGTAPRQMRNSFKPELSPHSHYELFLGNAAYWFGTSAKQRLAYVITQID